MQFREVSDGNKYGLLDPHGVSILPTQFDRITVINFNGNVLLDTKISSKYRRLQIREKLKVRKEVNKINYQNIEKYEIVEDINDLIFLVKRGDSYYLLKCLINENIYSTMNLYDSYQTLDEFKLVSNKTDLIKYSLEGGTIDIFKQCYKEIVYIRNGFFKIKFYDVYKILETINEDDEEASHFKYDNYYWLIINIHKHIYLDTKFSDVDEFYYQYCKVKVNDKFNFIDKNGHLVLKENYDYLERCFIPIDELIYLAGNKSYFLLLSNESGEIVCKTIGLEYLSDFISDDQLNENKLYNEIINKFSDIEISVLFKNIFKNIFDYITIEETINLDLYKNEELIKKMGASSIDSLSESILVIDIDSKFLYQQDQFGTKNKLVRYNYFYKYSFLDTIYFELKQKRIINYKGEFLNKSYYHEVYQFDDNGKAKVIKAFFIVNENNEMLLIDTSLDEILISGIYEKYQSGFFPMLQLKYSYIDLNGNEITEWKIESDLEYKY